MTGTIGPTITEGKIDPTTPKKTDNSHDKANSDGVLNEALPLLAGASVGTAVYYTALAAGGTIAVPLLVGGGALALVLYGSYRGGAEVYNYFNKKQPPKVDTPEPKFELAQLKPTFEPTQRKESTAKVTQIGGVTYLAI